MAEHEFIAGLYGRMTEELGIIRREEGETVKMAAASVEAVKRHVAPLREFILDIGFADEQEEVRFFKETKPRFYRHLIYFSKVMHMELERPAGGAQTQQKFLIREQKRLAYFFRKYKDFYKYLRSGASYLDKKLFMRESNNLPLPQELEGIDKDPLFTTSHDFIVAKISANEMLEDLLSAEISKLVTQTGPVPAANGQTMKWTASKAALTELLYALFSAGAINNGSTSIQQVALFLEKTFNTNLGNYYRAFQELRIRKKNRTQFIDELKSKLTAKMDFDDEHPR